MAHVRPKKRVLFVCRDNIVRSKTAEQVYGRRPDLEVRSAGVGEHANVPLTRDLLEWADEVFVFTKRQRKVIQKRFGECSDRKIVICLNLPDRFEYKSPKLVIKLTGKLAPYLGAPTQNGNGGTQVQVTPAPTGVGNTTTATGATGGSSPRQLLLRMLGNFLYGVMAIPFITGSVLLSPVTRP